VSISLSANRRLTDLALGPAAVRKHSTRYVEHLRIEQSMHTKKATIYKKDSGFDLIKLDN
jgi:hypothetical protein